MLIASRNAVVDSRGLYASTITRKYVVSSSSVETAEKYVVNRIVDSDNPNLLNYIWEGTTSVASNCIQDYFWNYLNHALNKYTG